MMAGEIEEPFSFSFQTESLHSGSVSFGRFESEPLYWERRSSFSHNRYLEEVEKCSKPGLVIEKKAYFEAHFKKKALLRESSSVCPNETEYQISENGISENTGKEGFEHVNEDMHFTHFDESPDGSDYHGDSEMMECERKETGISHFEPHMESAFNNFDVMAEDDLKHAKLEEAHQSEAKCDKLHFGNAEGDMEIKENFKDERRDVDQVTKVTDFSARSQTIGKDASTSSERLRNPSLKLTAGRETKLMQPRSKSQVSATHSQRNIGSEESTDSAKNRRERKSLQGMKTYKQSSQTANPTTHSIRKTRRPEDSEGSKDKSFYVNKSYCSSGKGIKSKKVVEHQPSASEKVELRARNTSNRPKQTVSTSKQDMKLTPDGFSFKSEERAERRKEFYMKLEEKMHAKEVEMNQIQARTQEKTETEIKQFRRSLDFKATPMPAFYRGAVLPGLDKNKAVSINTKSAKPSNMGSKGSRVHPKVVGNGQATSVITPVSSTDKPGKKIEVSRKNERGKEKDTKASNNKVSKMGERRSSNEMARKDIKGGINSRMDRLVVGVAS